MHTENVCVWKCNVNCKCIKTHAPRLVLDLVTLTDLVTYHKLQVMASTKNKTMDDLQAFTDVVKDYPLLLDQSMAPEMRTQRMRAAKQVKEKLEAEHNIRMSESQILCKLTNMKAKIKSKIDEIATGNKKTRLKGWEMEFFDFMNATSNSFMKIKDDVPVDYHNNMLPETEETKVLNMQQLQRLVLLEQLEHIRMQKQYLLIKIQTRSNLCVDCNRSML